MQLAVGALIASSVWFCIKNDQVSMLKKALDDIQRTSKRELT